MSTERNTLTRYRKWFTFIHLGPPELISLNHSHKNKKYIDKTHQKSKRPRFFGRGKLFDQLRGRGASIHSANLSSVP